MSEVSKDFRRLYVIGDIHGRSDLLDRMIDEIRRDLGPAPSDCLTVTLGDYIDRGPDSRGVVERLSRNPFATPYVALRGNHEQLIDAFLRDPDVGRRWRQIGGLETLHSYGVAVGSLMVGRDFEGASAALRATVPPGHFEFFASLKTSLDLDKYFLCHAGIRPGVPFEKQTVEDLLWIREEFLHSKMNFGKLVIHGHTPTESPEVLPNRINIDTGAFATGRLTCLVLDGEVRRFLST
jgi:serine/threonine protein phosphatase 1